MRAGRGGRPGGIADRTRDQFCRVSSGPDDVRGRRERLRWTRHTAPRSSCPPERTGSRVGAERGHQPRRDRGAGAADGRDPLPVPAGSVTRRRGRRLGSGAGSPALLLRPFPLASQRRTAHRFGHPPTRGRYRGIAHQLSPGAAADTVPVVAHYPSSKSAGEPLLQCRTQFTR